MRQQATHIRSRKDRRKQERQIKKKRKRDHSGDGEDDEPKSTESVPVPAPLPRSGEEKTRSEAKLPKQQPKEARTTSKTELKHDRYSHLSPEIAAMMRKDDEEIELLEEMLGTKKGKKRLYNEYAKLECYGDDFGEFLDDIDEVVKLVVTGKGDNKDSNGRYKAILQKDFKKLSNDDDFSSSAGSEVDDDTEEELIPMKEPVYEESDDFENFSDSVVDYENEDIIFQEENDNSNATTDSIAIKFKEDENESEEDPDGDDEDNESSNDETYKPSKGEDIYGNTLQHSDSNGEQQKKYTPPHLRKKRLQPSIEDDETKREMLLSIQRSLNSALNRLSEDSLVPVSQSIAQLYSNFPKTDVNECIWKNAKNACVVHSYLMSSLIPVYICAVAGVHIQRGDLAQLGEFFIEKTVVELISQINTVRSTSGSDDQEDEDRLTSSKDAANLLLILCYLYNFGVCHCSLLYDVVRNLVGSFQEVDVELLLLILSHCGRALRSDDPSALKEIVVLVQKTAASPNKQKSSRIDYMVTAMMDLRNNKRRKSDEALSDRTAKLRKALGQIKSSTVAKGGGRATDPAKISLDDILNAETKGRWWKVGASWIGNQYQYIEGSNNKDENDGIQKAVEKFNEDEDEALLALASKMRMNTDQRRGAFCIIMGSTDCEDCFEKLVRAGMLNNRKERDTVRVLMECCGNEKSYNKYYGHLASRICTFQPQCKFTFQLAYWDAFKQFEDISARKSANLAKLLYNLVAVHNSLKIQVLKAIDMASPEDLHENAMIFLTIFFTNLLEHCSNVSNLQILLDSGSNREASKNNNDFIQQEGDMDHMDDRHALGASITVFLMQVMKSSPKYVKGSKFRSNLKAAIKICDPDGFF